MNKKIHFAVIGCGHIGKRHIAMIEANEECELVALCDIKPFEELNITHQNIPFYQELGSLLSSHPEIDVVNICTPNGLHAKQSIECLEAQKHVVCEKPMGLTKQECEEVIFKALNVSRQVFVVMQNRYSPPIKWLKEVVNQKKLGEILMVEMNCYWNRDDRYYLPNGEEHSWHGNKDLDGGSLFTQFSHFIDILYWVFGDVKKIQSRFADFKHQHSTDFEDTGTVQFEFVNGGLGSLTFSTATWDKNMESSITVLGSNGSIKIGGQYMNELLYCHIEGVETPSLEKSTPPNDYGAYQGSAANHHYVIQNVVDVLKGRKVATTNALEGMKVVDIIERMYGAESE